MPDYQVQYFNAGTQRYEIVRGPNDNGTFTADDATNANGLAAVQDRRDGKYASFDITDVTATIEETQLISDTSPSTF